MKRQGLYTVLAAVAIQLTLGVAYIWSVFQTGVANNIFCGDNSKAGLTFSLLISVMCIGCAISGKLAIRYSTRPIILVGGTIMGLGFFLASFVTADCAWLLWVTYGIMGGLGMGFSYSTTIACAQKWYPHKKGLVTGVIVSALGFGGVIFTPIVKKVIDTFGGQGVGEPHAFMVMGIICFAVCVIGGFFVKDAPEGYMTTGTAVNATAKKPVKSFTTSEMLKTPQFYLMTATFFLASMGGLMMIAFAKPIAEMKEGLASIATVGVLAITISNSAGRLFWGAVSDKLGRINTLLVLLSITAILSLLVNSANGYWVFVLIACIGFSYGGLLSNFPSLTADLFGAKYVAANYGIVLQGFGVAAIVSTLIAAHYKNIADVAKDINLMFPAFVIASCCAVAGIVMMLVLRKISK